MIVLWDYYGIPEGILWDGILCCSYAISMLMIFLWQFHDISMMFLSGLLWDVN